MTWHLPYTTHLGYAPPARRPQFAATLGTEEPLAHVRHAAELGMAGILYPWAIDRPGTEIDSVARALVDNDLACSCILCVPTAELAAGIWTDRSAAATRRLQSHVHHAARTAVTLNSTVLAVVIPADSRRGEHARQCELAAANLHDAARIAADHGLRLAVEPMIVYPNMLLRNVGQASDLVAQADHANVGIIFDTAHVAMMDDDLVSAARASRDHIVLVQIADTPGRVEPGAGQLDLVAAISEVLSGGYTGLIDLEYDWSDPSPAGEQAGLDRLRQFDEGVGAALTGPGSREVP